MDEVGAVAGLLTIAVVAFVGSIRVGMLLGRLMDRRLSVEPGIDGETDAKRDSPEEDERE
jgi:hypothetical protein